MLHSSVADLPKLSCQESSAADELHASPRIVSDNVCRALCYRWIYTWTIESISYKIFGRFTLLDSTTTRNVVARGCS